MKIRPLYDRVVVKRIEQREEVHGGLYIPDSAKEKPQEGEVLAVGRGKRLEDGRVVPLDVQVGDHILFGKYPTPKQRGIGRIAEKEPACSGGVARPVNLSASYESRAPKS